MDSPRRRITPGLFAAALISLGLIIGGALIGRGLAHMRGSDRSVSVRGLAERDVIADLATWTITTTATGEDLASVQVKADADAAAIRKFLESAGFGGPDIANRGVSVSETRDNQGRLEVSLRQRFQLRTTRVGDAARAFARQADLVRQGVVLEGNEGGMVYSFTGLNRIKPAMIGEATRNARAGAEQFARDSGAAVGHIRSASQGLFSITARDGDAETEGGGGGRDSPAQKVRVVTTIDFALED